MSIPHEENLLSKKRQLEDKPNEDSNNSKSLNTLIYLLIEKQDVSIHISRLNIKHVLTSSFLNSFYSYKLSCYIKSLLTLIIFYFLPYFFNFY